MEDAQVKVKRAVDEIIDSLDKKYLRDIQKKMFLCSAKCCEDKVTDRDSIERCVDNCNVPMKSAQRVLEQELGNLQSQLSRCAMTCYDKLVQQYGSDPNKYTDSVANTFTTKLDACVNVCADEHIKFLPKIRDRFIKSL